MAILGLRDASASKNRLTCLWLQIYSGVDACQGDSGGPASVVEGGRHTQVKGFSKIFDTNILQIGIVSQGKGCGDPRYPGLYTRVSSLMSWLKEATKGYTVWASNCQKIVN